MYSDSGCFPNPPCAKKKSDLNLCQLPFSLYFKYSSSVALPVYPKFSLLSVYIVFCNLFCSFVLIIVSITVYFCSLFFGVICVCSIHIFEMPPESSLCLSFFSISFFFFKYI